MIHKIGWLLLLSTVFVVSCRRASTTRMGPYTMRDYVWAGHRMERISAPYVIQLRRGSKQLVLVGCEHTRDTTHPQFVRIRQLFEEVRPQIAFNEGGQFDAATRYESIQTGIQKAGESGELKFLCDLAGIRMMNGDLSEEQEFSLMLRRYSPDDLLLYYAMERLVIPYLGGAYGTQPFGEFYEKVIPDWFVKAGLPLATKQQTFAYFRQLYQIKTGSPFKLELSEDVEQFDYVNGNGCYYCALGRRSKMTRDSVLLTKLEQALSQYDRVMVTFGHGHALAIEPALSYIVRHKRR